MYRDVCVQFNVCFLGKCHDLLTITTHTHLKFIRMLKNSNKHLLLAVNYCNK